MPFVNLTYAKTLKNSSWVLFIILFISLLLLLFIYQCTSIQINGCIYLEFSGTTSHALPAILFCALPLNKAKNRESSSNKNANALVAGIQHLVILGSIVKLLIVSELLISFLKCCCQMSEGVMAVVKPEVCGITVVKISSFLVSVWCLRGLSDYKKTTWVWMALFLYHYNFWIKLRDRFTSFIQ